MNVTGIEWRDLDPHENRFPDGSQRRKHPPEEPPEGEDEDIVDLHLEGAEPAD